MKVQDLPHRAVNTTLAIATLPVRIGIDATRRTRELLERYDERRGPDEPAAAPRATKPAKPTAAEAPEIVAEETDGLAEVEVAHQP